MIHTIEFKDTFKVKGDYIDVTQSHNDKLIEWQKSYKGKKPDIKSVQRTKYGIFIVYEL